MLLYCLMFVTVLQYLLSKLGAFSEAAGCGTARCAAQGSVRHAVLYAFGVLEPRV